MLDKVLREMVWPMANIFGRFTFIMILLQPHPQPPTEQYLSIKPLSQGL